MSYLLKDDPKFDKLIDALAEAEYALDDAIRENGYGSPKSEPQRQAVIAANEALDAYHIANETTH